MQIVTYDQAKHALQEVSTLDEAVDLISQAEALQVYAHKVENTDAEVYLAEMKLRARRKLGEISKKLEKDTTREHDPVTGKIIPSTLPSGGKSGKKEILEAAGFAKYGKSKQETTNYKVK